MYLKKITDRDIRGKGVVGMADTPNLSPEEMQRKVEEILRDVVIPTMNENADKTVSKEDLRKFSYEAGIGDMYAGYYDKNYDGSVNMADNGIFEYTDSGEGNILTSSLENLTPVNGKFKCAKSRTAEKFIVKAPGKTGAEYRVKNGEESGKNLISQCWYTFVLDNRSKTLNFTGGEAGRRPGVYSNKNLTASPQNGDIWVKTDKKIKKVIFSAYGDKGKTQPGSEGDCIVFFNPGLPGVNPEVSLTREKRIYIVPTAAYITAGGQVEKSPVAFYKNGWQSPLPALVKNGVVESQTAQIAVAGYEVSGSDYSAGGRKISSTQNGWVFNINENGKFIADVLTRPIELDAVDKITLDISPTIPYGDYTVCAVFLVSSTAGSISYIWPDNYGGMIKTAVVTGDMSTVTMDVKSRSGIGYIGALVGTSGQRRNIGLVINNITLS